MLSPIEENKEFGLDETAQNHLLATTGWTKFLAIIGFICIALMLLVALSGIIFSSSLTHIEQNIPNAEYANQLGTMSAIGMGILFLFLLCIYFYPVYALMKFSNCVKSGIKNKSQELLNKGFRAQKGMYIYFGIFTIIVLIFYVIAILFMGLGAMMMGS